MKVRVYDKSTGKYFKSEVYAITNIGWYEKQLVHVPSEDGGYIKFFDYLDKGEDGAQPKVLINTIIPSNPKDWIFQKSGCVEKLLRPDVRFFEFMGYSWLFKNSSVLSELLNGKSILFKGSIFENRDVSSEMIGWNYVETNRDADEFMKNVYSFHDSVLKTANYISGAYVNPNRSMYPMDDMRQVTMRFDSQCCDTFEMVFEGVTAFNLRPAGDNYTSEISVASLIVKDESIFFCDDAIPERDEENEGTWISAYSLRWRFIR